MSRRNWAWVATMALLMLLVVVAAPPIPAQEADAPAPSPQPAEPEAASSEAVESILRQQEAMMTGARFSYEPAGRRDPFRNLFQGNPGDPKGKRPFGAPGMLVSELDLVGVIKDERDGDIALVIGSDNKGYFMRVGDQVFDGTIIAVDSRQGVVTFRQQIDDPRMIKPYRDVTKRLVPLEDEEMVDE